MKHHILTRKLQKDGDSQWHYLHVSKAIRDDYKSLENRGIIPVTATIGSSKWDGSLLPWADGSAQLSVSAAVRKREGLEVGDSVAVSLYPREL